MSEQSSETPNVDQPAPRHSRRQTVIGLLVLAAIVVVIGVVSFIVRQDDATEAKPGDCMTRKGLNSLAIVPCADPGADFKVEGRVEDRTEIEADINACNGYANAESVYWEGKQGKKGLVLCLAPVR